MGRAPCCDKERVKKGTWSAEEDAILKAYAEKHPAVTNWIALPNKIGLKRCGKSCRLRWLNYLRPDIKHGKFSEEEDRIISKYYFTIGSRWSKIAEKLPGRTDNDIKNYWNTKLKKEYGGNKRKSRPRHSFTGCVQASTQHSDDDDDNDNDDAINSINNPGGRRGRLHDVFTIIHGDVMSTSWPSTSQLLPPTADLNGSAVTPSVDDPLYMLTRSTEAAAVVADDDVSPSNAVGPILKELENLLFNEDEDHDSPPVMDGPDQIVAHTRGRNVVVSSWDDVVEMGGGGAGDLITGQGGDHSDVVVICGESVASWDVDISNVAGSSNCLLPETDPNTHNNSNDNNSNCDDDFLPQDILDEFSYTRY
ncbi:hypothetical protein V2J09_010227 [Rumex salicifolius]